MIMNPVIEEEAFNTAIRVKRRISEELNSGLRVTPQLRGTIEFTRDMTFSIANAVQGVR